MCGRRLKAEGGKPYFNLLTLVEKKPVNSRKINRF